MPNQCIRGCYLPYYLWVTSPVSCGGMDPAQFTVVIYRKEELSARVSERGRPLWETSAQCSAMAVRTWSREINSRQYVRRELDRELESLTAL